MAKGVSLKLLDGNVPLSNLSNLICLWWDQTDVYDFDAPIGRTNVATTDANGYLKLDITPVSGVAVGNNGFLVVYREETDYKKAPVFANQVPVISDVSNSTVLSHDVIPDPWVRPSNWEALPTITASDQEIAGLYAVFPTSSNPGQSGNFCAFKVTVTGGYTVDWGDGTTPENVASAVAAEHSFDYSDCDDNDVGKIDAENCTFTDTGDLITISNHTYKYGEIVSFSEITSTTGISTATRYRIINPTTHTFQVADTIGGIAKSLTTNGTGKIYRCKYRQAVIHVTRQNTGNDITAIDFNIRHSLRQSFANSTGWLDICLSAPNCSSLNVGSIDYYVYHTILERFNAVSLGVVTDFSYKFRECYSLKSIPLLDTSSGTNFYSMFYECSSLKSIPLLDTSSGTNFYSMFGACRSLQSIPLLDTSSGTTFEWMFTNCYSLKSIPLLDISSGTNISNMFSDCSSLQSVPLLDTSSGIDFSTMFGGCYSLKSIPLLDTSGGTDFSWMFSSCSSLQSVPLLDTSSGIDFSTMFNGCYSLQSVPLLDTSSGTNFYSMFAYCHSLKSIPLLDTSNGTNFSYMFNTCYSLESIPLLDTSSGTNFNGMFSNCFKLQSVPLLDTSSGTNISTMFNNCLSLQKGTLQGSKVNISYASCQLSSTNLDEIFSYLASNVTTKTITVTGNYGAAKVSLSGTTTLGSTTVTMADTTGLSENMWITGTNISSSRSVTFQDTGDTVTLNNHGIPDGTRISFMSITTTTGITVKTIYYVVNTQTNTFQIKNEEGITQTLTNDGSGVLVYENYIVSILPNAAITLSTKASGSGTITLISTTMNPYLATLKGWLVSN